MAYWLQIQSMSERERRRFDESLTREPVEPIGLAPGAEILAAMMATGGTF